MAFEIQALTSQVKRNPLPWAIGGIAAVGGGLFLMRKKKTAPPTQYAYAGYPQQEESKAPPAGLPQNGGSGGVTQQDFLSLSSALAGTLAESQADFTEQLTAQQQAATERQAALQVQLTSSLSDAQESFNDRLSEQQDAFQDRYGDLQQQANENLNRIMMSVQDRFDALDQKEPPQIVVNLGDYAQPGSNQPSYTPPSYTPPSYTPPIHAEQPPYVVPAVDIFEGDNVTLASDPYGRGGFDYADLTAEERRRAESQGQRVKSDPALRQSEIQRTLDVISNRRRAGQDTSAQTKYLDTLRKMERGA